MRIAIFTPNLVAELGGASTLEQDIFQTLLDLIPQSKHEFLVYTYNTKNAPKCSAPNLRFIQLKEENLRKLLLIKGFHRLQDYVFHERRYQVRSRFEKSLKAEGVDFVYYTTNRFQECNLPYLYTVLDIENLTQPGYPEVTADGEFERRRDYYYEIVPKATYVIAANEYGKQQLLKHFNLEQEKVIPLPYVAPPFALANADTPADPQVLQKYQIKNPFVYYPAKVYAHKNHYGILLALRILRDRYQIQFDAVFSGPDGGNRAYIEKKAREFGLEKNIHFVGFIPVSDVVQLYKNAAALTYLSYFAPSNIPALEAFALGCPVVNADVGGSLEEFGDAALLVNPADPEQAAAAILKIFQNPELRKGQIEKGRVRIQRWTMKDYVKKVLSIFDAYENIRRTWGS